MLNYIVWNVDPEIITWPVTIRWYGLMFAIGFWIGFNIVARMFRREGAPEKWMGSLLIYVPVATGPPSPAAPSASSSPSSCTAVS